jgi:hypothetical protein
MFWSSDKNDNYDEGTGKIVCSAFWPLIAVGVLSGVALAVIVVELWIIYEIIDGIDKWRMNEQKTKFNNLKEVVK